MFRASDLYPYVKANLRKRYPYEEGWIIRKLDRERNNPDFLVERRRKTYERAIVFVIPECKVTQEHLDAMKNFVENFSEEGVELIAKIFVVCRGCDTSLVPKDIEIMVLRSCECS
ncbi:MAG: hypothetical protein RQ967_04740 [Candidatus Caldipriscus sp.]|jgi:hypothetical protein|nr:hypothetical protein [Candidatus Caldipriscus sp.]